MFPMYGTASQYEETEPNLKPQTHRDITNNCSFPMRQLLSMKKTSKGHSFIYTNFHFNLSKTQKQT